MSIYFNLGLYDWDVNQNGYYECGIGVEDGNGYCGKGGKLGKGSRRKSAINMFCNY